MIDKHLRDLPGFRGTMSLLTLLSLVQGLAVVGQSYGLTEALVRIWQLHSLSSLPVPVTIFVVAFAVRQLCDVGKRRVGTRYADDTVARLRPRIQHRLFMGGPAAMSSRGTGATVTMLIDGLDQTKAYIQTLLPKVMDMGLIPLIVLAVVWTQSWLSGLVLLVVLPLLIFFMAILGLAARDKSDRQYGEFRMLNNRFVDAILGLPTLKMLGISDAYEDEIYTVSERFRKRTMGVIMVAMTSTFALDFFTTLSIAVVAVFLGNNLISGSVALFPALFALILAPEYFLPIRQFGNDYHATLDGKNAMNDIMALLETKGPAHNDDLAWDGWKADSSLELRHVDFGYRADAATTVGTPATQISRIVPPASSARTTGPEDSAGDCAKVDDSAQVQVQTKLPAQSQSQEPEVAPELVETALHDIDLAFHGHEIVAIIGRSGAGKSTLMNLLAGFNIPESGTISLDGMPLAHLNAAAWQRHISYIPQTPYIFHGTIADNIRFYRPVAGDDEVRAAATRAGLDDWLATLPQGLDTAIGEGNRGISGGQGQRIALARMLLDDDREIMLFDEPTAHLDIETEYGLKQTLLPLMKDHLVIFATHRLHWLDNVDRVVVLDHGGVVECGAPSDLIGHGGALDELIGEMGGNRIGGYRAAESRAVESRTVDNHDTDNRVVGDHAVERTGE